MPFTIDDAVTLAESWFEETLDIDKCLIWGNEFLRRIVDDKLWQESEYVFNDAVESTWVVLPADFRRSVFVEDSSGSEYKSYSIKNGRIKFSQSGDYSLTYVALPNEIPAASEEVPLPDGFEYPLAEFFIFKYYNMEIDDDDCKKAADEYERRYLYSLKKIYAQMEIESEAGSFQQKINW